MRLKLDENLPADAVQVARSAGFDVDTVVDEGLVGAADSDVVRAATDEGRLIVTLDRGLSDVRLHLPGTHAGIVVLRVADQRPEAVVEALAVMLAGLDLDQVPGCNVVVQGEAKPGSDAPRQHG
ncbi:MAG TPA: DUF5615 family PIN-like protein [Acidimicrobiales bacterium]|nr:DUF5615 family PIN-like protein [Acidimicrobiales bacterium]